LQALVAAAIFAALAIGFFHPSLLQDKTLSAIAGHQSIQYPWAAAPTGFPDAVQSDQANNVYPIQADLNRLLRHGEFPFWSPYSFSGGPTLGTVYGSGFYPPRLLLSTVLAPIQIHDLFLMLHVWLAGMAVFLLVRRMDGSFVAGLLAGVGWMFCPAWFGVAILEGAAVLAALLPLALWSVHRAVTLRSTPDAVACGVVLALFVLGASVQPAVFCFSIVCAWGLALGWSHPPAGGARRAGLVAAIRPVGIAAALGVALCAFLILPASAQISGSERAAVPYSTMEGQDVGLDDLGNVIDGDAPLPLTGDNVWALTYVGVPVALLALLGLFSRREGSGLGRSLVVVFSLFVVGTPLTRAGYEVIPGFAYLSPLGRLLPFLAFGVVLLAAVGLDTLRALVRRHTPAARREHVLVAFTVVALASVVLEAWQTIRYARAVNPPFQPRERAYLFPPTGMIQGLQAEAQLHRSRGDVQRLIAVRPGAPTDPFSPPTLAGEAPRLFSLETVGGYLNVLPVRSRRLSLILSGDAPAVAQQPLTGAYMAFYFSAQTRFDLLERLGVGAIATGPATTPDRSLDAAARQLGAVQVYSGPDGRVLRVPGASPRAFVVGGVETAATAEAAIGRFVDPKFPFRTTVVLDGPGADEVPERRVSAPSRAKVRVLPGDSSERNLEVNSSSAGWLVVLDSYDDGWSATVNGREERIHRADYAFRAVKVPAGRSVVAMHYRTPGLRLGTAVSLLGLLAALALLALRRRR
jgi:LPXTG-motif cell wall-anchored protein